MKSSHLLFVCIGNTCRSPMAEAVARAIAGDRLVVSSAGLSPTGHVAPEALTALRRRGYPSDGLTSTSIAAVDLHSIDMVVSLIGPSGLQWLPRTLGLETESWGIPDPYGEDEAMYDAVLAMLEPRVRRLIASVLELGKPAFRF